MSLGSRILAGAATALALISASAPSPAQDVAPALVAVDEVRREPLAGTVPVIGRMVARQAGVVAARTRAAVAEVRVQVGDRVDEGDVLAVLVSDRLEAERDLVRAEVAEGEAQVKTAEAALALARQELERLEALRESAAFSQARYDDKRQEAVKLQSEVAEANANLARARANLRVAEIDLYNAGVRAPYAGVVSLRHTEAGAYLDIGSPVVTLINADDLEIEADVPTNRIAGIPPGTPVEVRIGEKAQGRSVVRAIVPDENPRTRTRAVRFTPEFDVSGAGLAMNQTVILHLPVGEAREVTSVKKDAVINRQGQTLVFVVVGGDSVQVRAVKLGEAVGDRFEVVDGLKPGELVVVRGNERLLPGQKVRYEERS
jgi:RND family efflux transporter MFP subunit